MTPDLEFSSLPRSPEAAVLVLHGGRSHSTAPTSRHQLAVLRMGPFAKAIGAACDGALAVVRLRFTTRGWNGDGAGPLADARWALDELTGRLGHLPIGILGHSMGGRVALRVADYPFVRTVVGLAPWLPPGEPVTEPIGAQVLLMHGDRDRTTSARASAQRVKRLRAQGISASFALVAGDGHAMLRRPRVWHDLSTAVLCASLLPDKRPTDLAAALLGGTAAVTL